MIKAFAPVFLLLLYGCAATSPVVWNHPSGDERKFEADKSICASQALSLTNRSNEVQVAPQLQAPAYSGATTNCHGIGNMVTCDTQLQPNPFAPLYSGPTYNWGAVVANNRIQQTHFDACMYSRGYSKSSTRALNQQVSSTQQSAYSSGYVLIREESGPRGKDCVYAKPDWPNQQFRIKSNEQCPRTPD